MSLSDLFGRIGRRSRDNETEAMSIMDFVDSPYGLNMGPDQRVQLYPVQRFILKSFYHIELDNTERNIKIPRLWQYAQSAKPEHYYNFTELEYMAYLHDQGRCNLKSQDHMRRTLVLPIGRRSGKSFVSSIIGAFESYKLLRKGDPQNYYGMAEGAEITLSTVAPTKDQSQILYNAIRNYFVTCAFFDPYLSHDTQTYMKFQTPHDLDTTGSAREDGRASYQIRFFSSSSSGIRGFANIVVILDEVAFFKSKGGSSAQKVYDAVTPSVATFNPADPNNPGEMLSQNSEGRIIMISSPFAKEGLFFNQYQQSKRGGDDSEDLLMIQAPTWEVNPTVPVNFLRNFQASNPRVFDTEFGAQFTDRASGWIERRKDLMACVDVDLKPEVRGQARQAHYMGLDLAVVNDRTALVLTRPEGEHIRLVYHEQWQAGADWYELNPHLSAPLVPYVKEMPGVEMLDFDELANWVRAVSRKFFIKEGLFDQWHALSFQQTLDKMGLDQIQSKQFTKDETSRMYDAFKTLMYHNKLRLYDYTLRDTTGDDDDMDSNIDLSNLEGTGVVKSAPYIEELLELQASYKSKKVVEVAAPNVVGKHDDFADALIRSVWLSVMASGRQTHIAKGANYHAQGEASYHNVPRSATEYHRRKGRRNNTQLQRGARLRAIQRMNKRRW